MRAGRLDRRWTLQRKETTTDELGQEIETWVDILDGPVWGSWEPLKGSEKWAAQQTVEHATARVRFRYGVGKNLNAMDKIQNDELGQFDIVGEPEQYRREGETVCHVSRRVEE